MLCNFSAVAKFAPDPSKSQVQRYIGQYRNARSKSLLRRLSHKAAAKVGYPSFAYAHFPSYCMHQKRGCCLSSSFHKASVGCFAVSLVTRGLDAVWLRIARRRSAFLENVIDFCTTGTRHTRRTTWITARTVNRPETSLLALMSLKWIDRRIRRYGTGAHGLLCEIIKSALSRMCFFLISLFPDPILSILRSTFWPSGFLWVIRSYQNPLHHHPSNPAAFRPPNDCC